MPGLVCQTWTFDIALRASTLQVGAIVVSELATLEAALEKKLGCQIRERENFKAGTWRQQVVLRIEDVFLSQLHYRSGLLNDGFQNAVLQVYNSEREGVCLFV